MNVSQIALHRQHHDAHVRDYRGHEIMTAWSSAMTALARLETLTHDRNGSRAGIRALSESTSFDCAATCALTTKIIYDRIRDFIVEEI